MCKVCDDQKVEDECHFIFVCSLFRLERETFMHVVGNNVPNIRDLNKFDQLKLFMTKDFVCDFGKLIVTMINIRRDKLYTQ